MGVTAGSRHRVPAAQRREALIDAAVQEFAHGGLYGTPVDRVARRVGVAQPYVFSLFPTKRDLFLAAVQRGFERVEQTFSATAEEYLASTDSPHEHLQAALGEAYVELLLRDRALLMLQLQSYAACDDDVIRECVQRCWRSLTAHVERLAAGAGDAFSVADAQGATASEQQDLTTFFAHGMLLTVQAAIGVTDFSEICGTPITGAEPAARQS